jgi:hypothetical protein
VTPTLPTRVLLAATLALAGPWPAGTLCAEPKTAVIENAEIAVTISLGSGAITRVARKKGGAGYANPVAAAEMLRMRIPLDDWDGHAMVGSRADWHVARTATPEALTLTAKRYADTSGHEPLIVEIHYRLDGANVVAQLNMTNSGSRVVDGIDFPVLDVAAASDGRESIVTTSGPVPLRDMFSTNAVRTQHDPFERLDPEDPRAAGSTTIPRSAPRLSNTRRAFRCTPLGCSIARMISV